MIVSIDANNTITGCMFGRTVAEMSELNPNMVFLEAPEGTPAHCVGMKLENGVLSGEPTPIIAVSPVPKAVSPRQIRQALTRFNVRAQVEAAVAAGDQDLKDWWEFATTVERNHPMVVAMAAGLGISEADLDAIFLAAGAL